MKIRRLDRRDKGYTRIEWVLDYYEGPKRIRKFFKTKGEAEAAQDEIKSQHKHAGQTWIELTPEERNDLMLVVSEAKQRNVTIRQVWEAYKNGKLDATPMQRCTLGHAVEETITWRRGENLRERYLKELEAYLKRFVAGRTEMFVDQIGVAEIQAWFDARTEALSTRRANIGRLGSMFDVAWKKGYIKENPCLKLQTVKLRQEAPTIFTPNQAKTVLATTVKRAKQILPYVTLGMFAGIRPEEMEKLTWADVDAKHGTVKIDAAAAKTSRRRLVQLHATAKAWLKLCKAGAPTDTILPPKVTLRRYRRKIREGAEIEWRQDILRHTAGSYLLALHKNAHEVAIAMGNSARILESHYKDLVTESDCKQFWGLTPKAVLNRGRQ